MPLDNDDIIARLLQLLPPATMPLDNDDIVARLLQLLSPLELLRVAKMPEVERLSSMSEDSIERHHPEILIQLSPRRRGARVAHALMLRPRVGLGDAPGGD